MTGRETKRGETSTEAGEVDFRSVGEGETVRGLIEGDEELDVLLRFSLGTFDPLPLEDGRGLEGL